MPKAYDYQFKIFIIGDTGSGKSSILKRFVDGTFSSVASNATVSIDFKHFMLEIGSFIVKLQIWDTAGMEQFNTITTAYYRGAEGVIAVYDTTNANSLKHVPQWVAEVNRFANDGAISILAGNKADLEDSRVISTDMGQKVANSVNASQFFETSAADGTNIEEIFTQLTVKLLEKKLGRSISGNGGIRNESISLESKRSASSSRCCG